MTTPAPARTRDDRGHRRSRNAFSLIELVVVLTIIATLSAIALPRFAGASEGYRVDSAARRIVAELGEARRQALATGEERTVRFDKIAHACILLVPSGGNSWIEDDRVEFATSPYRVRIQSATFDDPAELDAIDEVVFDGFGQPDSPGNITVAAGGRTKTVVVQGATGEASVQ